MKRILFQVLGLLCCSVGLYAQNIPRIDLPITFPAFDAALKSPRPTLAEMHPAETGETSQ